MGTKAKPGDKRLGNQFWEMADPFSLGRNPKYSKPEQLWEDAKDYFKHCDDNPIESVETKVNKSIEIRTIKHKIPYTWEGLYVFIGVCNLHLYKSKKEFINILTHVRNIIYNQKFTGAAAGLFNSNIIIRDLGLKDKQELEVDDKTLSDEERKARIAVLLEKANKK